MGLTGLGPVLGAEAAQVISDASTVTQAKLEERLDYSLHPHDGTAPAVRSRTGTHVKFPLLKAILYDLRELA